MNQPLKICGITPRSHYPKCCPSDPCVQICENDRLCLPYKKPNIECILEVCVNVSICSHKIICTPLGAKLVIEAIKHIKIMYVAEDPCQTCHTAHCDIPFCLFILLKDPCPKVIDICTAVEHIAIKKLDCRCFAVSTIIFACAILKKPEPCPCEPIECCTDDTDCTTDDDTCNFGIPNICTEQCHGKPHEMHSKCNTSNICTEHCHGKHGEIHDKWNNIPQVSVIQSHKGYGSNCYYGK